MFPSIKVKQRILFLPCSTTLVKRAIASGFRCETEVEHSYCRSKQVERAEQRQMMIQIRGRGLEQTVINSPAVAPANESMV